MKKDARERCCPRRDPSPASRRRSSACARVRRRRERRRSDSLSLRAIHHSCPRRSPARPPAQVRRFMPGRLGRNARRAPSPRWLGGPIDRTNPDVRSSLVSTRRSARKPILTPLSGGHFAETSPIKYVIVIYEDGQRLPSTPRCDARPHKLVGQTRRGRGNRSRRSPMTPVTRNAAMQVKDSPPSPATFPSLHDTRLARHLEFGRHPCAPGVTNHSAAEQE
jgi:hypothetical protein